jgi:hypothetical protein
MAFHGCHVRKASQQNGVNFTSIQTIAWDQEVFDTDGWHDNVTNNSRLTVPSSMDGLYGRFTFCLSCQNQATASNQSWIRIMKNGALFVGGGYQYTDIRDNHLGYTGNGGWWMMSTGPMLLVAGDYYEAQASNQDNNADIRTESGFSVYIFNQSRLDSRVFARKASTLTSQDYSSGPLAITWDQEAYDTDNYHDNSTNPSRITIPSACDQKYVIVHGQIRTQNNSGAFAQSTSIRKGGSSYTYDGFGGTSREVGNLGEGYFQCHTHPMLVSAGDFFELMHYNQDTVIDIHAQNSHFGCYCVSA